VYVSSRASVDAHQTGLMLAPRGLVISRAHRRLAGDYVPLEARADDWYTRWLP
jgi:hypothetical protein